MVVKFVVAAKIPRAQFENVRFNSVACFAALPSFFFSSVLFSSLRVLSSSHMFCVVLFFFLSRMILLSH
jgi:hypothetical protein